MPRSEQRRRSHNEGVKRRAQIRREFLTAYKLEKGCSICGYRKCERALSFHHIDPETKTMDLGKKQNLRNCSKESLLAELSLCEVLCENCHRELEHGCS